LLKEPVHALGEALLEVLRLPVEVAKGLLKFADVMGIEVPNQARPWAAVLVALFIIVLPFLLDKCRSKASRIICAYGVLCLLFICVLIASSNILSTQFARFEVQGNFDIKTVQNDPTSVTFPPVRWGSDACDANENHTNRVCSSTVQEFTKASVSISSANCGSGIASVQVDPADKKCIVAVSHLQGCGYDRLPFHINNCRGRGWIEFAITGAGSAPVEHSSGDQPVAGTVSARDPLVIKISDKPLEATDKVEFRIEVRTDSKVIATLTNAAPSQGDFAANLRPDGQLQVSYGKLQPN
jgi:hypothetical protein